jgi:hypothetical protein
MNKTNADSVKANEIGNYRFVGGLETREVGSEEAIEIDSTLRSFLEQRFQSIFVDTEDRSCPYLCVRCPPMMRSFVEFDNICQM